MVRLLDVNVLVAQTPRAILEACQKRLTDTLIDMLARLGVRVRIVARPTRSSKVA